MKLIILPKNYGGRNNSKFLEAEASRRRNLAQTCLLLVVPTPLRVVFFECVFFSTQNQLLKKNHQIMVSHFKALRGVTSLT